MARILLLFDVDGTLTVPRACISHETRMFLKSIRGQVTIGVVGGSDRSKILEQLGPDACLEVDYFFAQNGLMAYHEGKLIGQQTLKECYTELQWKEFLNFCLKYLAEIDAPGMVKRGTFIEFRTGMLNISPIGRNCSQEERDAFEKIDHEHGIRSNFIQALKNNFSHLNFTYSIGGQISFDVFPQGWDKTFCLKYIPKDFFDEIHFFGDKTFPGGNDYEIFVDPRVKGHTVTSPEDTIEQVKQVLTTLQ